MGRNAEKEMRVVKRKEGWEISERKKNVKIIKKLI